MFSSRHFSFKGLTDSFTALLWTLFSFNCIYLFYKSIVCCLISFGRAAQKLSISSKKKHKKSHTYREVSTIPHGSDPYAIYSSRYKQNDPHAHVPPYPFPTKFKEALHMNTPAVPPTLLKNGIKRTDGKVRVYTPTQSLLVIFVGHWFFSSNKKIYSRVLQSAIKTNILPLTTPT